MRAQAVLAIIIACMVAVPSSQPYAALVTPGTPTTTVPTDLIDPLGSLSSPLPADEFLLPIEITGASSLQDWSFDLNFADGVVTPVDVGGLYQSVYQARFSASDLTPSNITSSGFLFAGSPQDSLQGIAGFSSGVSGDGLLAYILFQTLQKDVDPGFSVQNVTVAQAVPEPSTLLLISGLLLLGGRRLRWRAEPI